MIKLGRLKLENFKSFLSPCTFNFSDQDLVLLDGPNGFGKTTLFDAIELCIRGEIHRIISTDSKVKTNHLLKCELTTPTFVVLELLIDTKCFVIVTYIPPNISGKDNKISAYSQVTKRFLLDYWPDNVHLEIQDKKELEQSQLNKLFDNPELSETFNLFNYIQQEETCHFMKLKENDRHNKISYLFGTVKETHESKKLNDLSEALKTDIASKKEKMLVIKGRIETLSDSSQEDDEIENLVPSGLLGLLENLESDKLEGLEEKLEQLNFIKWAMENPQVVADIKFNSYLETLLSQRVTELNNIVKLFKIDSFNRISRFQKHKKWAVENGGRADSYREIVEAYSSSPNTLTESILDKCLKLKPIYSIQHKSLIERYKELLNLCDSQAKILQRISGSRENLKKHYEEHIADTDTDSEINCPFCGDIKNNAKTLEVEYEKQQTFFESLKSDTDKELETLSADLIEKVFAPICRKGSRFIDQFDNYFTDSLLNTLSRRIISEDAFVKMDTIRKWLNDNLPGYDSFVCQSWLESKEYEDSSLAELKDFIRMKIKPIELDGIDAYSNSIIQNNFKLTGVRFDSKKFTFYIEGGDFVYPKESLLIDLQYLTSQISLKKSNFHKSDVKLIEKLDEQISLLKGERDQIDRIRGVYRNKIRDFEKTVAKQIAIPFFIYSSKILQTRPEGSGVILSTPANNQNGYIRFCSSLNDSHDAWNTMSSGQLAGVVISFMLAMNSVYPTEFSALLIDDPVQSMDEVNMASFVQLLRNEFPDKQLVLSTHESKVANYLNYKFNQSDSDILRIDMKSARLN